MQTQTKVLVISAIVLIVLLFSDVVSTDFALEIPGLEEANPWSRRVLENWGIMGLYISFGFLSILALTYPGMYLISSRLADYFAEEGTNGSKPSFSHTKRLLFIIPFSALVILILQRLLVVTNNILLIISLS